MFLEMFGITFTGMFQKNLENIRLRIELWINLWKIAVLWELDDVLFCDCRLKQEYLQVLQCSAGIH